MRFEPARLREALARTSGWSLPSSYEGTKVHHGYRQLTLVLESQRRDEAEPFAVVLDNYEPVYGAWLSSIDPGGFIAPHRDAGPYRERWQVPIEPAGVMEPTGEAISGEPFRVRQWEQHSVWNLTETTRVHLVIDRDELVPVETQPFASFPVPERYEEVICGLPGAVARLRPHALG